MQLNVHYCVMFSSKVRVRIRVRIRFSVWLVSRYAHVCVRLQVVIVTLLFTAVSTTEFQQHNEATIQPTEKKTSSVSCTCCLQHIINTSRTRRDSVAQWIGRLFLQLENAGSNPTQPLHIRVFIHCD